jgi:hypothetical protein
MRSNAARAVGDARSAAASSTGMRAGAAGCEGRCQLPEVSAAAIAASPAGRSLPAARSAAIRCLLIADHLLPGRRGVKR